MSEALRLADWCEQHSSGIYRPSAEAAAELRRLAAVEKELEALKREELRLHQSLAQAVSHAEQGWARYENANRISNGLQQELEASRAEQLEQARIIGMSADRELALRAELEALKRAISDAEPVAWDVYVAEVDHGYVVDSQEDPQLIDDCTNHNAVVTPLYTLKGIK